MEPLKFTHHDMDRILASLLHAAHSFDEESRRQRQITVALAGHPLGVLGGVMSEVVAELFTHESQQLRELHTKLEQAISTSAAASTTTDTGATPGEQKDGTSGPSFE